MMRHCPRQCTLRIKTGPEMILFLSSGKINIGLDPNRSPGEFIVLQTRHFIRCEIRYFGFPLKLEHFVTDRF